MISCLQQENNRLSTSRVRLGQQSKPPRLRIVIPIVRIRIQALIQIPQLAPTNRQSLVDIRTHNLTVANMLRPRRTAELHIRTARKRIRLGSRELVPRPGDAV